MKKPENLADRPTQDFGGVKYMVPWFVAKIGDRFDFRVVRRGGLSRAIKNKSCWLCGKKLGPLFTFVIGPMCAINRITSEPPCHPECALYAALTCPFLTRPQMKRSPRPLPEGHVDAAGVGILRNPGVACLWGTRSYNITQVTGDEGVGSVPGILFEIGDPVRVLWYRQGREATREEVMESINTGFPLLEQMAQREGSASLMALHNQKNKAMGLLPA